jgi:Predicted RNA methylase
MTTTAKRMDFETDRLALQSELDSQKTQEERNRLGQFATPTALAADIAEYASKLLGDTRAVRFLDPAIGTGSFYSAVRGVLPKNRLKEAVGFEIDRHYGLPAKELWAGTELDITIGDFTAQAPEAKFNLVISNPPYVRHHHLSQKDKQRLQMLALQRSGIRIAGLSGLYCYFLALSHAWLADDAVSAWLIPSEFMDVNYGSALKQYLLEQVTLLHIHRFDPSDVQFADALVSSAVVWFRNKRPPRNHAVEFSFGGSLSAPTRTALIPAAALATEKKWTRFPNSKIRGLATEPVLSDFFKIKRGLATGDNNYFILSADEVKARKIPKSATRPILPSPRYLAIDEILADANGNPDIERKLFLLDPGLDIDEIEKKHPTLFAYLQEGIASGLPEKYLCAHRRRWYDQENRPAAPIYCTYLGRSDAKSGRPFRFILNNSKATIANVYLALYPTPLLKPILDKDHKLIRKIWEILNSISPEQLLGEGRVYGGGLHKLEPRELGNLAVPQIAALLPPAAKISVQQNLFAVAAAAE